MSRYHFLRSDNVTIFYWWRHNAIKWHYSCVTSAWKVISRQNGILFAAIFTACRVRKSIICQMFLSNYGPTVKMLSIQYVVKLPRWFDQQPAYPIPITTWNLPGWFITNESPQYGKSLTNFTRQRAGSAKGDTLCYISIATGCPECNMRLFYYWLYSS